MQWEAAKPLYSNGNNSSNKTNSWERTPRESLQQKCPPSFSVTESGRKLQSLVITILGPVSFLGLQFPFWFLNSETRTPKSKFNPTNSSIDNQPSVLNLLSSKSSWSAWSSWGSSWGSSGSQHSAPGVLGLEYHSEALSDLSEQTSDCSGPSSPIKELNEHAHDHKASGQS